MPSRWGGKGVRVARCPAGEEQNTSLCKFCGERKSIEELKAATRFSPPLTVCRDCWELLEGENSHKEIRKMEIQCGAQVVDSRGQVLGTISQVISDMWTGQPRKFVVRTEKPLEPLFFSPKDVVEATDTKIKVKVSVD